MKFYMSMPVLTLVVVSACGGEATTQPVAISGGCELVSDCNCPAGATAGCEEKICYCTVVETVTAPRCETNADCDCGNIVDTYYEPVCQEDGICMCREVNRECFAIQRGEFVYRMMRDWIDLNTYTPASGPHFPDVPPSHQYYTAIEAAVDFGLVSGNTDGTFRPNSSVNRAEGSKFICRLVGADTGFTPPASPTYFDVAPDQWYYTYVEALTAEGLTVGYVDRDGNPLGIYGPANAASSCFVNELLIEAELPTGF